MHISTIVVNSFSVPLYDTIVSTVEVAFDPAEYPSPGFFCGPFLIAEVFSKQESFEYLLQKKKNQHISPFCLS